MLPPHATLRAALYPVALRAVRRGEFECATGMEEHVAGIVANYAATDLILKGETLMLPASEVEAAVASVSEIAA